MHKHIAIRIHVVGAIVALGISTAAVATQSEAPPPGSAARPSLPAAPAGVTAPVLGPTAPATPAGYLIGADDLLSVVFWRDKDMTTDVVVRPDGKISLPVLGEIQAGGLTPEQLRSVILEAAGKYFEDPSVYIVPKQINSRKVFVTGEVNKPGTYALSNSLTVIQILALAGGLTDFAKKSEIAVIRTENGQPKRYRVNYSDILKGKSLQQNIELRVGDVVIVP
jgi:polysaccharide export outer membrane protein